MLRYLLDTNTVICDLRAQVMLQNNQSVHPLADKKEN
jgi:hypothetical protein